MNQKKKSIQADNNIGIILTANSLELGIAIKPIIIQV